jgi:hypothetical protein
MDKKSFIQELSESSMIAMPSSKSQIYDVFGEKDFLLYIKISRTEKKFWGIGESIIDELNQQKQRWFVVLLSGKHADNYVLSDSYIEKEKHNWSLGKDKEYKLTELYLNDKLIFENIEQFKEKINYEFGEK